MPDVNIFGFVSPGRCPLIVLHDEKTGLPSDFIVEENLDFDPSTGSTKVNSDNKVNLYKLIQTYKGQCGVEYIKNLVSKGMLSPASIADDGKSGGDASMPLDQNDLYRESLKANRSLSILAKELGITLDENTTDEEIAKAIVSRITPKEAAKADIKPVGGDK